MKQNQNKKNPFQLLSPQIKTPPIIGKKKKKSTKVQHAWLQTFWN